MKFTKRLVVGLVSTGIIATLFTGCTNKDVTPVRAERRNFEDALDTAIDRIEELED